uniref:Uncharacterized protein n=1 Tax=Podoviridae sp. ctaNW81 TaxID=2826562 RepID=A0A8S5M587_9CAUD|nr:MAG TPA: hypothetical protein [Podoviridae sp. ctaNW81]
MILIYNIQGPGYSINRYKIKSLLYIKISLGLSQGDIIYNNDNQNICEEQ